MNARRTGVSRAESGLPKSRGRVPQSEAPERCVQNCAPDPLAEFANPPLP